MSSDEKENRDELLNLYKLSIDATHFQVRLNWDRSRYYFALNAAIIGIATGLLRLGDGNLWLGIPRQDRPKGQP